MQAEPTATQVIEALDRLAEAADKELLQRYFKTGPGQYGEGDVFIGVKQAKIRAVCREYRDLPLTEVAVLCGSPVHEHRMAGLIILNLQYPRADPWQKEEIFRFYLDALDQGHVNNWDLVDVTCRAIIGEQLRNADRSLLYELARSDDLWHRRVAVLSTFGYISSGDVSTSLDLADILLHDKHDLIHKAVGWMLREIGARHDEGVLRSFLDRHAHEMPRTMLRYAIEKLPPPVRRAYLDPR